MAGSAGRAPRGRRPYTAPAWRLTVGLILGALAIAALFAVLPRPPRATPDSGTVGAAAADRVVVLPLRIDGLREDAWVRLGGMDLVADRLREAGLGVPPSENVLGLLQAGTAASRDADPARVRASTGARLVVHGRATRGAAGWKVELVATPVQGLPLPVEFAAADAMPAARGASDLLLAALGRSSPADRERDGTLEETLQRARAALLANELDTARAILTASPQLGAAPHQLAYQLAQVDFRAGRLDQAEAALDALLSGPATRADAHFRAQVLVARASRARAAAPSPMPGATSTPPSPRSPAATTCWTRQGAPRPRQQPRRRASLQRCAGRFRPRTH